ncbi:Sphingosine N-acyltransferase lag1 [Savitreella phatthalungensis]
MTTNAASKRRRRRDDQKSKHTVSDGFDLKDFHKSNNLQIVCSASILMVLSGLHLFVPAARRYTDMCFGLSYCDVPEWLTRIGFRGGDGPFDRAQGLCGKGEGDVLFVGTMVVVFTFVRAACLEHVFAPASRLVGVRSGRIVARFAEQAWGLTYAATSWSAGLYLLWRSPYYNDIVAMMEYSSESRVTPVMKLYYLVEFSFWLQQVVALNVESHRKDYVQMFGHHLLTCSLLYLSWAWHTTRVGHAILTLMDFADILLPLAKLLKYAKLQRACDAAFVGFLISWLVTRHYLLGRIIYKIHIHRPFVKDGRNQTWIFVYLLSALELVICVWSAAIVRVLLGVLTGRGADDSRSDSEDSDTDQQPITNGITKTVPTTHASTSTTTSTPAHRRTHTTKTNGHLT